MDIPSSLQTFFDFRGRNRLFYHGKKVLDIGYYFVRILWLRCLSATESENLGNFLRLGYISPAYSRGVGYCPSPSFLMAMAGSL